MERAIEHALRRALQSSLLGVGVFAGCASAGEAIDARATTAPVNTAAEAFHALTCPGGTPIDAAELRPAEAHDYVALRTRVSTGEPDGSGTGWTVPLTGITVDSETGKACASATSPLCLEQVGKHEAPFVRSSCGQLCLEYSVVATRGDTVTRSVTPEQLRAFVGDVDSPADALLLTRAADYNLVCGDAASGAVRAEADGYGVIATRMTQSCAPIVVVAYTLHVARDGTLTVKSEKEVQRDDSACVGRRPAGLCAVPGAAARRGVTGYLTTAQHLEAASVVAFERLAHELEALGAPPALIARAREARDDERRHATRMAELVVAHGGVIADVRVAAHSDRSIEEIARENAVEGCVIETYGAVVGAYQAHSAEDPTLRAAMVLIAEDEARHASLSHAVHAFLWPLLDSAAQARVRAAQEHAIERLASAGCTELDARAQRRLGLPTRAGSQAIVGALRESLWQSAA